MRDTKDRLTIVDVALAAGNCNFCRRYVAYAQRCTYAPCASGRLTNKSRHALGIPNCKKFPVVFFLGWNFFFIFCHMFHSFLCGHSGIINRGDSFRRRRSRSNSLAPSSPMHPRSGVGGLGGGVGGGSSLGLGSGYNGGSSSNGFGFGNANAQETHQPPVEFFRVEMLGSAGVGKQALVSQFRTSDCINAYDGPGKFEVVCKPICCSDSIEIQ